MNTDGNVGTSSTTHFIGTTDNQALTFRVNNTEKLRLETRGSLTPLNTGHSVFIGEGAGENDNLNNNRNIAIGANALNENIGGGKFNIAIGQSTLKKIAPDGIMLLSVIIHYLTILVDIILLVEITLYSNTTGESNMLLEKALYSNVDGDLT